MLRSLGEKTHLLQAYSRRANSRPASVHLAPDVAVSILHSDCFTLKGLLCLCNAYACVQVASARATHRTHVLPARLRLPDQAPEIQVLWFTNVVWLHYSAALMHKIFGVSVDVINNLMCIHCLLMISSVLSNDFPLILIIFGNVLGLRGLNLLDRRGDGIRTYTTKRISKSRTITDSCYMGCLQSALLLSPSLLRTGPKIRAGGRPRQPTEKWAVQSVCNCCDFGVVPK
jgi:hypothetical protein